jgi:hypothetical protein
MRTPESPTIQGEELSYIEDCEHKSIESDLNQLHEER